MDARIQQWAHEAEMLGLFATRDEVEELLARCPDPQHEEARAMRQMLETGFHDQVWSPPQYGRDMSCGDEE